jgi:hypothetical protein
MFRSLIAAAFLLSLAASSAWSDEVLCPRQKEPACQDILPAKEKSCDRAACNVAKNTDDSGRTSCLWTCAAHFRNFSINGVPLQSLFDAFKKSQ